MSSATNKDSKITKPKPSITIILSKSRSKTISSTSINKSLWLKKTGRRIKTSRLSCMSIKNKIAMRIQARILSTWRIMNKIKTLLVTSWIPVLKSHKKVGIKINKQAKSLSVIEIWRAFSRNRMTCLIEWKSESGNLVSNSNSVDSPIL